MPDPKPPKKTKTGKKKGKRVRAEPTYVPVAYPLVLGLGSFAWAVAGWLIAAFAPRLSFVPAAGVLHLVFPAVTVGLLAVNLVYAVRNLLRGAHVLRLALVTGVEVALFTTLFFQLYAHGGAELYDAPGETTPWQWLAFSAAHAFRAGDVFDVVEAYGWGIQPVKHVSPVVGLFVVAYHVVVDVFFLGLVWAAVGRFKEAILDDDEFRGLLVRVALAAFAVWFVAWVAVAFVFRPWRFVDIPLWFVENVLRVVDFADVMESFGIRLHTLPREGVVGTLTFFCRLWIGVGLAVLITRKRKTPRRVLTPPGVAAGPYWGLRVGALAGMAATLFAVGLCGWLAAGRPADALVAAVKEGPDGRAEAALRGLRRMGPAAGAAVPELVAARTGATPAVRDGITRTLGYLGKSATDPLRDVALTDPPETAVLAVDSLAAVGGPAAPALVAVWDGATGPVKDRAEAAIRQVGGAAVAPLIDGFTPDNAHGNYVWLEKLDPNWRLRGTSNPTARACQDLPDLIRRMNQSQPDDAAKAMAEMKACGTATRGMMDELLAKLADKEPAIQSAAVELVASAGPAQTPRLLGMARGGEKSTSAPPGVTAALNQEKMWDATVYADPETLPTLLKLVDRPDGFPIAVKHLGHYGPAAAPATAALLGRVADSDEGTRTAVWATLDRVRPKWKTDGVLTDHVPAFLFKLPQLPAAEADTLLAGVGVIPAERKAALQGAIAGQLKETNEQFRGPGAWTKDSPPQYAKALDGVYGPVERLGPKARVLAIDFYRDITKAEKELNDPKARLVAARLKQTIPRIGGTAEDALPQTLFEAKTPEERFDYLRRKGKAAVPEIARMLGDTSLEDKEVAYRAAAALGADGAELVPRLLAGLPKSNYEYRAKSGDLVWPFGRTVETLTAIDPDWWTRPEAVPALAPLTAAGRLDFDTEVRRRRRLLDMIADAGPRAAPLAAKLGAANLATRALHPDAAAAFTKLDPNWRADPAVVKELPGLFTHLAKNSEPALQKVLASFGPAAVESLGPGLDAVPVEILKQTPTYGGVVGMFKRVGDVLDDIGAPARAALPALLRFAGKAEMHPEGVAAVVATADKLDPGWEKADAHKAAAKALGDALLTRIAAGDDLFVPAARCGADIGPELTKWVTTRPPEKVTPMLRTLGTAGPVAKTAVPALLPFVDGDGAKMSRGMAVDLIGKLGAGTADAAAVAKLAPLVLDPKDIGRHNLVPALDRVDPKWRASAAAKQAAAAAVKQATTKDKDETKRHVALAALAELGAGTPALVPPVLPLLLEIDPLVNRTTPGVLDKIDPKWRESPAGKQLAAKMIKQLTDPGPGKQVEALRVIGELRPAEAVAPLTQFVAQTRDGNLRDQARLVLDSIRKDP